jgi:hypothetical protein
MLGTTTTLSATQLLHDWCKSDNNTKKRCLNLDCEQIKESTKKHTKKAQNKGKTTRLPQTTRA